MTTFADVLKKSTEINQLIKDWGYDQPRLFKGVIHEELGHLNILVTPIDSDDRDLTPSLSRSLETLLNCDVVVTPENRLSEEYRDKILEDAISLNDKSELLKYYGENYQFDNPDTNMQAQFNIYSRELIRKNLIEERKRKREKLSSECKGISALSISCKKQELPNSNDTTLIRNK
jgi:hypothetical protein